MLCVKKVIVICREVNSQTGQIAVYVVPMEIDEHTVVRLSLRSSLPFWCSALCC